jgi:hypothetical protein
MLAERVDGKAVGRRVCDVSHNPRLCRKVWRKAMPETRSVGAINSKAQG